MFCTPAVVYLPSSHWYNRITLKKILIVVRNIYAIVFASVSVYVCVLYLCVCRLVCFAVCFYCLWASSTIDILNGSGLPEGQ